MGMNLKTELCPPCHLTALCVGPCGCCIWVFCAWSPQDASLSGPSISLVFWAAQNLLLEELCLSLLDSERLEAWVRHGPERGLHVPTALLRLVIPESRTPANETQASPYVQSSRINYMLAAFPCVHHWAASSALNSLTTDRS